MTALVTHTGATALSTQGLSLSTPVSNFVPERGAPWSKSAGQVASMARAAYRAVNGSLALFSVQSTVHTLNETDGSLNLAPGQSVRFRYQLFIHPGNTAQANVAAAYHAWSGE